MAVISRLAGLAGFVLFLSFMFDWVRVFGGFAVVEADAESSDDRKAKQHAAELTFWKRMPRRLGLVVFLFLVVEWTDGVPALSK